MQVRPVRHHRAFAIAGAVAGLVIDIGYLRLISNDDTAIRPRVVFVAAFIGLMSFMALLGAIGPASAPRSALGPFAASIGFIGLGFVALWSIGLSLILAGLVTVGATRLLSLPARQIVAAIVAPLVTLVAGLALTPY